MAPIRKSNRAMPFAIWGAVIILAVLAIYAVRVLTHTQVGVITAQVSYQDVIMTSPTTGKVVPIDDFQAHALAPGQVQHIYVKIGEKVKAGQLLLRMDDSAASASLASTNSALHAAELTESDIDKGGTEDERNAAAGDLYRAKLQRQQDSSALAALKKLQQQGAAAPDEVAAAQHRLDMDDSTLHSIEQHGTHRYGQAARARAKADLASAQAAVAAAQRSFADDNIRTPISGTVYYLPVSEYDYVNAGDSLVYVANLTHMRIAAYFDEPEIGNLAVGQPVTIAWEAKPGRLWHGHITQVPTTIITYNVTRYVGECLISVDDADGVLQPNANVTVTVTTARHLHVLTVPREAVHTGANGSFVFRVIHNKLVRTPVKPGSYNLVREEIVSGLSEGDTVALNATTPRELSNGLDVFPVPSSR